MGTTISGPAYIPRGTKSKCTMGTIEQNLNLPKDHGVVYSPGRDPLMNANDHKPNKHILKYGMCKSLRGFCSPVTPLAWQGGNDEHRLDGAPALTEKSKLPCAWGGVISIVPLNPGSAEIGDQNDYGENFMEELGLAAEAINPMSSMTNKIVAFGGAVLRGNVGDGNK